MDCLTRYPTFGADQSKRKVLEKNVSRILGPNRTPTQEQIQWNPQISVEEGSQQIKIKAQHHKLTKAQHNLQFVILYNNI